MTISVVQSTNVAALVASPIVLANRVRGSLKVQVDKKAILTTSIDEVGDITLMAPLPSNAIITSIRLFNDDLDSHATPTLAADLGVYYTGLGGNQAINNKTIGTVVDADCIATAITTLQAANTLGVELLFEANDIVNIQKELWEVAGLSADCGGELALALTITTVAATAAAGDIAVIVTYI